jgi:hypothetical protein
MDANIIKALILTGAAKAFTGKNIEDIGFEDIQKSKEKILPNREELIKTLYAKLVGVGAGAMAGSYLGNMAGSSIGVILDAISGQHPTLINGQTKRSPIQAFLGNVGSIGGGLFGAGLGYDVITPQKINSLIGEE